MAQHLPIGLSIVGKRCLVVGGGRVGARKARTLIDAGANVVVVDPADIAIVGADHYCRGWQPGDSTGAVVTVAATDSRRINQAVAVDARALHSLVLRVDDPDLGDLHFAAVHRVGTVTVAVDTGGASPTLAKYLRDKIASETAHWAALSEWARQNRPVTETEIATYEAELRGEKST